MNVVKYCNNKSQPQGIGFNYSGIRLGKFLSRGAGEQGRKDNSMSSPKVGEGDG
jgi:hypothetical protein